MSLYYLLALAAAILSVPAALGRGRAFVARVTAAPSIRQALDAVSAIDQGLGGVAPAAILAVLVATFFAEVAIVHALIDAIAPERGFERALPVAFLPWKAYGLVFSAHGFALLRAEFACVLVLRACALRALWLGSRSDGWNRRQTVLAVVVGLLMYVAAVGGRSMVSADVYGYVAYARLGALAYAPPPAFFAGAFAPLGTIAATAWDTLNPAPYGPLWLGASSLLFGHTATIFEAIAVERLAASVALAVLAYSLWSIFRRRELVLLVMLNPTLIYAYVLEGHNDIFAIALIAAGASALKRFPLLAVAAVVAAGLIKAPYAVIGTLVFAALPAARPRICYAAASVVATAALSIGFGGKAYLGGLLYHVDHNAYTERASGELLHFAVVACAIAAIAAAVLLRRVAAGCSFVLPSLAAAAYPWYLGMSLPYALLDARMPAVVLTLFPLSALAMQPQLGGKVSAAVGVVLGVVFAAALATRRDADATVSEKVSFL